MEKCEYFNAENIVFKVGTFLTLEKQQLFRTKQFSTDIFYNHNIIFLKLKNLFGMIITTYKDPWCLITVTTLSTKP